MILNKSALTALFSLLIFLGAPAFAQETEAAQALGSLPVEAEMMDMPVVKLQSLDKVTARTMTFEANVGSTVKFGSLYIKAQGCRKASPIEKPESAAFLQVWEVDTHDEASWVFSGWMFASSPGLSSMDHPIYDVWVLDCLEKKGVQKQEDKREEAERGEGELDEQEAPVQPEIEKQELSE